MPKPLDLRRLQKFEPSGPAPVNREADVDTGPVSHRVDRWPSREPLMDGQISIKGPLSTIKRFQALCKEDRRTYADMLKILMDKFEQSS
ncbi:ribbon-helix-helix protein [Pontitalea aquivivens]